MFSMGLWTLGFYDSISFMSINLPLASSPALLKSDHGCPLLQSILTYFTCFFCSLVLFCQCLKTRAICQAQGWAGVRGIKSILCCEPGIFLCEAKPGVGAIRMLVQAQNVVVQFQRSLKRTERDQHSCNRQLGLPQVARTVGSMKLTHIFKILGHQRPPFLYAIF